jgi:cation diffusion facilitator family transporter
MSAVINPRQRRLQERKLIRLSIGVGSALTLWAIFVGISGDSKAIIFDALYSLVGISLSGVSLLVNNFIRKPDDELLPFGRSQFQPFAITLQSSVIICLCLYTLATSAMDIANGGKEVELGIALPYLVSSIIICFLFWLHFKNQAIKIGSEYVRIEATEWQLDALLSLGVLMGLSMGYFLKNTSMDILIPYLDSTIVIVISLFFLRIPLQTFRKNIRELLQFSPDDEVEDLIHESAEKISEKHHFLHCMVRVAKTGKSYNVEIDFLLPKSSAEIPLVQLDNIRQELYDQIKGDYEMWLTISFTTERKWMI